MVKATLALVALAGLSGCASAFRVEAVWVSTPETMEVLGRPARVRIFSSELKAPRSYVVLAKLFPAGDQSGITRGEVIEGFQKKAAECGANGVVLVEDPQNSEDISLVKAPPNANDRVDPPNALEDHWAPVTLSRADIDIKIGGNVPFRGYALAVKYPSSKP